MDKIKKFWPCYYAFLANGMMALVLGIVLPYLIEETGISALYPLTDAFRTGVIRRNTALDQRITGNNDLHSKSSLKYLFNCSQIFLSSSLFISFSLATLFNIKSIALKGNVTIADEVLLSGISDRIGLNIFTVNQKQIKDITENQLL